MKAIFFVFALVLSTSVFTSCSIAPSERVATVQTLKGVGHTADAAVALSAQLYRDERISAEQARQVLDFYNTKFQPSYRLAVAMVNANLDSLASPDLVALASQLSALITSFQKP